MTAYVHKTAGQLYAEEVSARAEGAQASSSRDGVLRLSKKKRVSSQPGAQGLVSQAYDNAVFLQAMSTRFRGLLSVMAIGFWVGIGFGIFGMQFEVAALSRGIINHRWGLVFLDFVLLVIDLLILVSTATALIRAYRIDLFGPKDIPIVFNRKTRKVYRFIQDLPVFPSSNNWSEFVDSLPKIPRYWLTALKPWPRMLLIEYDWDCLEAEYFEQTRLVGKVITKVHVLQLVAKESPDSDKLIGGFTLMSPLTAGRGPAMDLWEHIRRFMEENGPALSPGDKPAPPYPKTFLQAANTVTPAWPLAVAGTVWTSWLMWRDGVNATLLRRGWEGWALFGITLVCGIMTALFVFNWLAHKFGQDVELPPELMADVGERVDLQRLAVLRASR